MICELSLQLLLEGANVAWGPLHKDRNQLFGKISCTTGYTQNYSDEISKRFDSVYHMARQ